MNTTSCKQSVNEELLQQVKQFNSQQSGSNVGIEVYVVIPNQGCEGCISEAENFVINHATVDSKNVLYIFTHIQSLKVLKYKLGKNISNLPNVKIDTGNVIVFPDAENQIYPMFLYTKGDKITKVDYQSPKLSGLTNLQKYLNRINHYQ